MFLRVGASDFARLISANAEGVCGRAGSGSERSRELGSGSQWGRNKRIYERKLKLAKNKMPEEQFKRHIAFKLRIKEILIGKPIMDNERFSFLELGSKRISRANLIGNIVDKYESTGDTKYVFFTLDDGSGQIQLRVFGDDYEKFKNFSQGQTVLVIGLLRYWNNEVYVAPEIIKEQDPKYLLVRKLELEQEKSTSAEPIPREQIIAVKDKILGTIKNAEENGGIDIDQIIMDLQDISPEIINQEIEKFISEGIVFEPRPGRVRYLG